MKWLSRRRNDDTPDPDLREAEYMVRRLEERAHRVESILRPRHERNHWSQTVDELWRGKPA